MECKNKINAVVVCPYGIKMRVCTIILASFAIVSSAQPLAPALYIFGDSLADVGNNNYLQESYAKAIFPHNGIDFPTHKPTGRFTNGKNTIDFLADKLGLSSPPPYLSMVEGKMTNFQTGVNFASGGACMFNGTDQAAKQSVHFNKQLEYYSIVRDQMKAQLQESGLRDLQSKAIHFVVIGSNDILGYETLFTSSIRKEKNPTEFVALMVTTIKAQLQRIYELGGRKFVVLGLTEIGCCPQQRIKSTSECNERANAMAINYNKGLLPVLDELSAQLQGFKYTYFDTYKMVQNFTQNPQLFGFKDVKSACCGLGNLNADFPCIPFSMCCPNRSEYLFWDLYHPTEAADRFVADAIFDDQNHYTKPINLRQLVSA